MQNFNFPLRSRSFEGQVKLKSFYFFLVFLPFSFCLLPSSVHSQEVSIASSPSTQVVIARPGSVLIIPFHIQNLSDPSFVQPKVVSFMSKGDKGLVTVQNSKDAAIRFTSVSEGVELEKAFFIKGKEEKTVNIKVEIGEGIEEKDYYYSFMTEVQPPPPGEGKIVTRVRTSVVSHLLVTVTRQGALEVNAAIARFDLEPRYRFTLLGKEFRIVKTGQRIPVVLVVENKGKNALQPQGEIIVRGNFGERTKYDIAPSLVLSHSKRLLLASRSESPTASTADSSFTLSGFYIGRYNLGASVSLGEGAPVLYAKTSFIAIPDKLLLAMLIGIIIFMILKRRKIIQGKSAMQK